MKQYLVIHELHIPEHLQGGSPRVLNGSYRVFSDQDGQLVADLEMPLDENGQPANTLEQTVTQVAAAMYAGVPIIRLRQSEALNLLATPQWRLYVGEYDDKDALEADALEALGINVDKRKTLETLVAETQAALQSALTAA